MSHGREIAFTAAAAALFGGAIVAALDWERATATFPMVICGAGLALAIWAIVKDVAARRGAEPEPDTMSDEDRARARGSFVWIGVFFAAVLLVGFEWGVGIAALAFYRIEARLGWVAAVLSAAACGGFLYVAAHFLNIPLYEGVLLDMMR
jgi:hypothetical protein